MTDEWENALGSIRWAAEYFIKCHVSDYEFYGQVGDFNLDQGFWGRPEDMNMSRPAYKIDRNRPGKYGVYPVKRMTVPLRMRTMIASRIVFRRKVYFC